MIVRWSMIGRKREHVLIRLPGYPWPDLQTNTNGACDTVIALHLEELMYTVGDLKKGLKIEIDGEPYDIVEYNFNKPGKGHALYNCKLKSMITGATLNKTYRQHDKFDRPELDEKTLTYSYAEGDTFVFMNEDYEQIDLNEQVLGTAKHFLVENMEVTILFHKNKPIDIRLPTFVEKTIVETEPGARGNTATNVLKSAKVEGGYEISVPLFVSQGDVVKIDTRTGEYSDRVRKK